MLPPQVSFILDKKLPLLDAASAAFLSFYPEVYREKVWLFHKLRSRIAVKFEIEIRDVHVCGSAQFGYSLMKGTPFVAGSSDLDIAIVSATLFAKMFDIALRATEGFSNLTRFDDTKQSTQFQGYAGKFGIIRPDLLPRCNEKQIWLSFFRSLSMEHRDEFKSISGTVYISEAAFANKQSDALAQGRSGL